MRLASLVLAFLLLAGTAEAQTWHEYKKDHPLHLREPYFNPEAPTLFQIQALVRFHGRSTALRSHRWASYLISEREAAVRLLEAQMAKAAPPPPAPTSGINWYAIANCESGGRWDLSTGNGYFGGLQFTLSTWQSAGGTGYPYQWPASTQIAVAERWVSMVGCYWCSAGWPVCGRLG